MARLPASVRWDETAASSPSDRLGAGQGVNEALQRAFEDAGLEFMNGDRPGLRLGSRVAVKRFSEQTGIAAPDAKQKEFWNNPPRPRKER